MKHMNRPVCTVIVLLSITLTGCLNPKSLVSKDLNEDLGVLTAPIPSVNGPKRTVAVGKFTTLGSLSAKYGEWDVGGGMGAMLTTALVDSKQFLVLERAQLQQILTELQLKGEGVVAKDTGPQLQQLYGAQLLVFGAVTEFGDALVGGGMSVGFSSDDADPTGGSASREKTFGKIKIDIRIVDTTTGAVLSSFSVQEIIESKATDLSADAGGVSVGGNRFMHTPIGEAARKAITQAVQKIASTAGNHPWKGQVIDVEQFEVHVNAGSKADINKGDRFLVKRVEKQFTDPVTGKVLGERSKVLGAIEVTFVQPLMATGTYQAQTSEKPKRGDTVVPE